MSLRATEGREAIISMLTKQYFVYFLTNWNNKVLYVGVTNDLKRRLYEHQNGFVEGFTKKYNLHKLVHFEVYEEIQAAILREKQIKGGSRKRKNDLVEKSNPMWEDLSNTLD